MPPTSRAAEDIIFRGCYVPEIRGQSFVRALYAPELLAGVIFDVYNQHSQIITELDVKLNKWHITIEKLYRKPTETEQNFKNYDPTVGSNCESKAEQARSIALRHQATRWKWSKAPI